MGEPVRSEDYSPASKTTISAPNTEGAKSGDAHGGKESHRNKPHRGDNKKRQKGSRGSSAKSVLEEAAKIAVDQAAGAAIASRDMHTQMKEMQGEVARLEKEAAKAKKYEDDHEAAVRARIDALRRGFDLKLRWRPTYLPFWRHCFVLLSWFFLLVACAARILVGVCRRVENYLSSNVDMFVPLFEDRWMGTFLLFSWIMLRILMLARRLIPFFVGLFEACESRRQFLRMYAADVTPPEIRWWEFRALRVRFLWTLPELPVVGDLRPDANKLQELRHKDPLYAEVIAERKWSIVGSTSLVVSLELVAQLTAPRFVSMGSRSEDLHDRMIRAAETYPFINLDKYSTLCKQFVANDSVRLAKLLLEYERSRGLEDFLQGPHQL